MANEQPQRHALSRPAPPYPQGAALTNRLHASRQPRIPFSLERLILFATGSFAALISAPDTSIALLTIPLAVIGTVGFSTERSKYITVRDIFWLLTLLFFIAGPCQSVQDGRTSIFYAGMNASYPNDVIQKAFFISYVFFACIAGYCTLIPPTDGRNALKLNHVSGAKLVSILIVSFILVLVLIGGPSNLLRPRWEKSEYSPFVTIAFGLQVASTALIASNFKGARPGKQLSSGIALLFALALLAISFNPFNSARFFLIGAWLPIGMVLVNGKVTPTVFAITGFVFLLVVMPILSITGRFGVSDPALLIAQVQRHSGAIPYIDVIDVLIQAVAYTDQNGLRYGQSLTAIALFFIPRSIWPDKPVVSSMEVGGDIFKRGLVGTDNLSMPFVGELYTDGGIALVIFGSLAICLILRSTRKLRSVDYNGVNIVGFVLMASLPVLYRGPLGAVLPFALFILVAVFAITFRRSNVTRRSTSLQSKLSKGETTRPPRNFEGRS